LVMQSWNLTTGAGAAHWHALRAQGAVAGLIGAVARPGFAAQALQCLNDAVAAGSWSVYQLWPQRPPRLHLSASRMPVDSTAACFATYHDAGLYRCDSSFAAARQPGGGRRPVLLRMHADEAPSSGHRDAIYRRHGISERLSVACLDDDDSLLAVNLYRHSGQGAFSAADMEAFGDVAHLLLACVRRQIDWQREAVADDPRAALRQRCPALTERELDVLQRLLRGMTYDGIAADMGLSVGTVKTYRARAFARLGLHFRSQLFASLMPSS
jgi:DNA-binding CsgD family transcriptional regulator